LVPFAEVETRAANAFDDSSLIEVLRCDEWGRIAIDVSLGWPRNLLDLLERWRAGKAISLPADERRGRSTILFRETDLAVWDQTGLRPIPVGVESLGWVALRSFHLLSQADLHADHAGLRSHVIETYPKAAISRWPGMPAESTKSGPDSPAIRDRILRELTAELALEFESEDRELLVEAGNDHRFDALICALVARAAMLGKTALPTKDQAEAAQAEGWIHLPAKGSSVRDLARPQFLDVEMPSRFVLETLEANEDWLVWGDYTDELFERLPDGPAADMADHRRGFAACTRTASAFTSLTAAVGRSSTGCVRSDIPNHERAMGSLPRRASFARRAAQPAGGSGRRGAPTNGLG
jgi:hypothetical protein